MDRAATMDRAAASLVSLVGASSLVSASGTLGPVIAAGTIVLVIASSGRSIFFRCII